MIKNNESKNYLEKILEASKKAKTVSELSETSGLTKYRIYSVLKENPVQKTIVTESLRINKEKKKNSLTKEQQEIYDMFMKMAENRKENPNSSEIVSHRVNDFHLTKLHNANSQINLPDFANETVPVYSNISEIHNRFISLPVRSIAGRDTVRMKLKNDSYSLEELIRNNKRHNISNDVFLHVGDNIYSIRFFFNNDRNSCLLFRHLRIKNLLERNNAEIVYSAKIYSDNQLKKVNKIYQWFIKRFIDTHSISF